MEIMNTALRAFGGLGLVTVFSLSGCFAECLLADDCVEKCDLSQICEDYETSCAEGVSGDTLVIECTTKNERCGIYCDELCAQAGRSYTEGNCMYFWDHETDWYGYDCGCNTSSD